MHCVHVKEVAHDSSKRFSRGRHFYKRLLLAGAQRRAWEVPAGAQRRAGTGGLMGLPCLALSHPSCVPRAPSAIQCFRPVLGAAVAVVAFSHSYLRTG